MRLLPNNATAVSIPDQNGPVHRWDNDQWFGSFQRLVASAPHVADARQGALAAGQFWGALMGVLSGFGFAALAQAEAVAVHLKDVHMMGEPVEDGAGQAF